MVAVRCALCQRRQADEWMTVRRAADLLGVQYRSVYNLIERGELSAEITLPPGPKRRAMVRLKRADVDAYIQRCRVEPGTLGHLYPPGKYENQTRKRWSPTIGGA